MRGENRVGKSVPGSLVGSDDGVEEKEIVSGVGDIEFIADLPDASVIDNHGEAIELLARVVEEADNIHPAKALDEGGQGCVVLIINANNEPFLSL